jgi:hypothetical protein
MPGWRFEHLRSHGSVHPGLNGAKNGVELGQGFVHLTSPQGNAVVSVPQHLLAQLHRVVPVFGEDTEHIVKCGVDPIAVIRVGDCQCGGDYRQPDPVLSPQHGFRSHPGDEGVTCVEHELQQWPEGFLHLGEACQAVTGIRPVTVIVASPELAEYQYSCMPPVSVHPPTHPSLDFGSKYHWGTLQMIASFPQIKGS